MKWETSNGAVKFFITVFDFPIEYRAFSWIIVENTNFNNAFFLLMFDFNESLYFLHGIHLHTLTWNIFYRFVFLFFSSGNCSLFQRMRINFVMEKKENPLGNPTDGYITCISFCASIVKSKYNFFESLY